MKASEKRLLFALLGIFFLGAVVISSDFYFDKRDTLVAEAATLETEWVEIEALFEEKEIWEMRADWLTQQQPKFTSNEQIDQAIYQEALADKVPGVTTSKQTLLPTVTTPDYVQAGVSLSASGDLPSVFRWLHLLNRPESFRVIRNLKVQPDKEKPENVIATFELLRWYASPEA
jgi:acyl-CoA synthetase (AMP-forming)/AMP-acid ligase II